MNKTSYQKKALLLGITLAMIAMGSLLWIYLHSQKPLSGQYSAGNGTADNTAGNTSNTAAEEVIADIYQNGILLQSLSLSSIAESYSFTIEGEGGAVNEIEARPGCIGILSASCPDKLCVHQGFISNSLLPITCLPNRLVIQIRQENRASGDSGAEITPDIITY